MERLSHLDDEGKARMVDVGSKGPTERRARAEVYVDLGKDVLAEVLEGRIAKGDSLAVARIAGIQAAKKCSELIPLCHLLSLDVVHIEFEAEKAGSRIRIVCDVACTGKTGVEMEALTGAAVAALTIYDMCKALDKGIAIDGLRLLSKEGGKSGDWVAAADS